MPKYRLCKEADPQQSHIVTFDGEPKCGNCPYCSDWEQNKERGHYCCILSDYVIDLKDNLDQCPLEKVEPQILFTAVMRELIVEEGRTRDTLYAITDDKKILEVDEYFCYRVAHDLSHIQSEIVDFKYFNGDLIVVTKELAVWRYGFFSKQWNEKQLTELNP